MNDIWMRCIIATIAGLTYLAAAVGSLTFSQLGALPVATWLLFIVNILTGFVSPSMVKKAIGVKA